MPDPFIPSGTSDSVGEQYLHNALGPIGGTNNLFGTTPFTSGGVTNICMPLSAALQSIKDALFILSGTAPAGTGTLMARMRKRKADGTLVNLTAPVNLFGRAQFAALKVGFAANSSAIDRQLRPESGDLLFLSVDNTGGSITTQPTAVIVSARTCVLR